MKITRYKKSHKTLMFFATHFNYHEPYQVLVDATFCQAALKNKVIIEEQIKTYFQTQVKLLTTQCIIMEAESLGAPLTGATQIVKQFFVHKCGHEGHPVSAAECIKQMTKDSRYIIASQDRALQASLRKVPGRCLLYLHKAAPVLEAPSEASKKWVHKKANNIILPQEAENKIVFLKQKEGLIQNTLDDQPKRKHKGSKNPNPLSCKKSKKQRQLEQQRHLYKGKANQAKEHKMDDKSITDMKPKRKRIKIPAHVKEVLKNNP